MSCPICKGASQPAWRPFCSRRCADVDLANWLRGAYAIAADETGGETGAETLPDNPETGPRAPGEKDFRRH